jgi:hypothetical protein
VQDSPNSASRVDVPVRDSARREVDPIAAKDPLARPRIVGQLPDDRGTVDTSRAEAGLVPREVVDDALPGRRLDTAGMLREHEDQWKY